MWKKMTAWHIPFNSVDDGSDRCCEEYSLACDAKPKVWSVYPKIIILMKLIVENFSE